MTALRFILQLSSVSFMCNFSCRRAVLLSDLHVVSAFFFFYFLEFWPSRVGYELCYADLQGKYKKKTCTFPFRDFHVFPYSGRCNQPSHHTVQRRTCSSSFPSRHLRSSALHTHATESKVRGHMLRSMPLELNTGSLNTHRGF